MTTAAPPGATPVGVLFLSAGPGETAALRDACTGAMGSAVRFNAFESLDPILDCLGTNEIDVVIVDLDAPTLPSGGIRQLAGRAGDTSIVALARADQREAAVAAMRAGAQDYLLKSVLTPSVVEMTLRYASERARTLRELRGTLSLLSATLESTADGILVVDGDGRIATHNRKFAEMWRIPDSILESGDDHEALRYVQSQLKDPDAFLRKVRELYGRPDAESYDVLEFKDGRVFERFSLPQRIGGAPVGRVWSFRDVTAPRTANEALRQEHDLLTAIIENAGEAVFAKDLAGRYILMNTMAADFLGTSRAAVVGRTDEELFAPEQARHFREVDTRIVETGQPVVEDEEILVPDGIRYTFVRKGPLRDREGHIIGVIGAARDVTARRRAERAVRDSEERYRAFIAQSTEGVWRFELERPVPVSLPEADLLDQLYRHGFLAECNETMARMHGFGSTEAIIGARLGDLFPREDPQNAGVLQAFIRSGFRLTEAETGGRPRPGGARQYVNSIVGVVESGLLIRAWGTQRDVTERKRAERIQAATYRISEAASTAGTLQELLPAIHASVSDLMPAANFYAALLTEDGRQLTFPYFVDSSGTRFETRQLGKGLTEYVLRHGRPLLATPEVWQTLVAQGEVELIGAHAIDWLGVPLTTSGRTFGALAVQSYDPDVRYGEDEQRILTFVADQVANAVERLRAATALRAAEERYRAFIEQTSEGVWRMEFLPPVDVTQSLERIVADVYAQGYVAECNKAMAQMYGYETAQDLVGMRIGDLHDAADPINQHVIADFVRSGFRSVDSESHERTKEGELRIFLNNSVGFVDGGRLVRWWGTQRDVTERRRLEDQLRQAQKMEAVGRLAGGIAHDFNNILTAILGTSDLMLRDLPGDHVTRNDVHEIRRAALRAADLTRQLLAYSRRQVLAPKVIDLNGVLAGLGPMLRRLIGEDIELVSSLAADLPAVRADPGQVEQVVLNLVVNARDAMPEGGRLTLETGTVIVDGAGASATRPTGVPSGTYALLGVVDTGSGMTAEVRAHLFEPFFTTKDVGKGTGLGLATVYGIVEQSGGHIAVESEPHRGTAVRIFFPAALDPLTAPDAPAPVPMGPTPTETILLVEDEDAVRGFARRALEAAGYRVLEADNGPAALLAAEQHRGPIHLLLTDVVMPGMSGREVAEQLLAVRSDLRVVYTSGYTDDAAVRHGLSAGDASFLQKPFSADALLTRVRQTLVPSGT